MLFITVVYEIFLGGNIYMSRAEPRPARRKEILVVTLPSPAQRIHADNIQINFLFLMEFFTTCKCL